MTRLRIMRTLCAALCDHCWGTGQMSAGSTLVRCTVCGGTGQR